MELFGIEKLSLVDYDGYVSATIFTGTCNFRCGFCHNAPLVTDVKSLETLDENEVFSYLNKRKGIIEALCITGGEPTLQKDLPEFCEKVKNIGLRVKVDTNGTNLDMIKTLVNNGVVDYFAMDVKNDKSNYGKTVGIDNYDVTQIEKTVDYFVNGNVNFEFRTTVIKEYHTIESMENLCKWIKGAKNYAIQKFKATDTCINQGLNEVPLDLAKKFLETARIYVKNAKLRGYDL